MEAMKDVSKLVFTKAKRGTFPLADDLYADAGNRYAAALGFPICSRLYAKLDDCDLCRCDSSDETGLQKMSGDLYGGSSDGGIYQ